MPGYATGALCLCESSPVRTRGTLDDGCFSRRKRGSMFLPALGCVSVCVCLSVCDHDNQKNCGRICIKFYGKVPRGKGKTKFVFRYDR